MPNLVLFSVLWLDCSLCSNGEVWREMASDGKKGKKGRGREGKGRRREFRRETARVAEGRRGTPDGHHNRLSCFITKHWAAKPLNLFYVFFLVPFHSFYLEIKPICYKNFTVYCEVLNLELLVFRYLCEVYRSQKYRYYACLIATEISPSASTIYATRSVRF